MFIFSLNSLTVCLVREFVYNLVKQYTAIFDIKQNNVEATGLIEHQNVLQAFVPNFHFNRYSYIYFYIFTVH